MKVRPSTARSLWSVGVIVTLLVGLFVGGVSSAWASTPVAVERGNYRGECRRLSNQINHYERTVLPMAMERGNRAWASATNAQIERLWHRRADLCPQYAAERTVLRRVAARVRQFNQMLATAARAAATYFTGGVAGGVP